MGRAADAPRLCVSAAAFALLTAGCEVGVSAGRVPLPPEGPERAVPAAVTTSTTSPVAVDFAAHPRPDTAQRVYVDELVAGAAHACVRSVEGEVRCWGSNEHKQLGRSTSGAFDATPDVAGHGVLTRRVFAGPTQTAALDRDGQLGHWGLFAPRDDDGVTPWSKHDTPGVRPLVGVAFGEAFAIAWDDDGSLVGWGAPDGASFTTAFIIKPVIIHLGFGVSQAAVWSRRGDGHGCLVVADGTVACWGSGAYGQPGMEGDERGIFRVPPVTRVRRVAVGERFSCALRDDATAWCWGGGGLGQLGDGVARVEGGPVRVDVAGEVLALSAGARHACALTRDGAVWCWGVNDAGQLGTASVEVFSATPVRVAGLPKATGVAAGDDFTCALTEDRRAYCWGNNDLGQLGDGSTVRRAAPMPVRL